MTEHHDVEGDDRKDNSVVDNPGIELIETRWEGERLQYARLLASMAEVARMEADAETAEIRRKALWGVASGLEIAATVLRSKDVSHDSDMAKTLLARYKPAHYAHLVQKERKVRLKQPNLHVKRVVKGKKANNDGR